MQAGFHAALPAHGKFVWLNLDTEGHALFACQVVDLLLCTIPLMLIRRLLPNRQQTVNFIEMPVKRVQRHAVFQCVRGYPDIIGGDRLSFCL